MGLKTTNYKIKKMNDFVLPNAYAYIIKCYSERQSGWADIGVFADRESAENGAEPFEVKRIYFTIDRNENDRQTAYTEAKKQIKKEEYNEETHTYDIVMVDGMFTNWQDDIQV